MAADANTSARVLREIRTNSTDWIAGTAKRHIAMNSFIGFVIVVMLFLVNFPARYSQQNSLATQRKAKSGDSVTIEPEPFCPPKEVRDQRFCPQKQSRVNAHRDCTALMQAAEGGNIDQVRALLQSGADVNEARGTGHTALMLAAGRDNLEMVQTLLKAGANPNAIVFARYGIPGWAWMVAMNRCNKHWREMTEAMLAAGVELNPKTIYPSPLGHAIHEDDVVIIKTLLKKGANPNLRDIETGETLLMSAAKYSTPEVVQTLIEGGADVNARNKLGQTALTLADHKDNLWREEIVRLLTRHGGKQ
jgi:ankyrin repeat protein